MHDLRSQPVLVLIAIAASGLIVAGQQGAGAGRYTAAQAAAGRATYQAQLSSARSARPG
jgi:hypothetical protein